MKKNIIGENIKNLRGEMGLTQEALALEAGLTQSYINFLESGKRGYTRNSLEKISESLGVPISKLFEEEPEIGPIRLSDTSKEYKERPHYDELIDLLDKLPKSVIKHYIILLKAEIKIREKEK